MTGEKGPKCLALRPLAAAIQRVAVYETKLVSILTDKLVSYRLKLGSTYLIASYVVIAGLTILAS